MHLLRGIIMLLLFSGICRGQNLFPNPGFEQYSLCPDYTSQIDRCIGWDSINGTADYYNCGFYMNSTLGDYGVPHSGSGVAGIFLLPPYTGDPTQWYGEIFGAELLQPLIPGAKYRLSSWWLSPSTCLPVITVDCYDVGFYFYKSSHPPMIPLHGCSGIVPQVRIAPNQILEMNYTQFTSDFIADSCYDRVMIGFFCRDTTTTPFCLGNNDSEYFDVDDISLTKIADATVTQSSFALDKTSVCEGDTIRFTNTSSNNRYAFEWTFNGGNPSSASGPGPHSVFYNSAGTYDAIMVATFECGSDTITRPAAVKVLETPSLELSADTALLCVGIPRVLTAQSNANVSWSNGNTGNEITVKEPGTYIAMATNVCGTISDSVYVPYKNCPCDVWVPSAFTPNNDGKNEFFKAYTGCVLEQYRMRIYNRFGQEVFSASEIENGWDGTMSTPAPEGIYVAVIQYEGWEDGKLKQHTRMEKVALLR